MKLGTIVLIAFMVIFYFNCIDADAKGNQEVHGLLGHSVILPTHKHDAQVISRLRWLTGNGIVIINFKDKKITSQKKERFSLTEDGSLKIDKLEKSDETVYKSDGHDNKGKQVFDISVKLQVLDPVPQPQLNMFCINRTLICEVTANSDLKPEFTFFQNEKEVKRDQAAKKINGTWWVKYQPKIFSGKFRCEVNNTVSKNQTEEEISCSNRGFYGIDLYVIFYIGGGLVIFVIAIALLVYCIKKKRAKRHEREDQERELHIRIADEGTKYRKLPQSSAQKAPNRRSPQRPLPPVPKQHQQAVPPQPRPRPHQKPPQPVEEIS